MQCEPDSKARETSIYGYGYGWEISYARQAYLYEFVCYFHTVFCCFTYSLYTSRAAFSGTVTIYLFSALRSAAFHFPLIMFVVCVFVTFHNKYLVSCILYIRYTCMKHRRPPKSGPFSCATVNLASIYGLCDTELTWPVCGHRRRAWLLNIGLTATTGVTYSARFFWIDHGCWFTTCVVNLAAIQLKCTACFAACTQC